MTVDVTALATKLVQYDKERNIPQPQTSTIPSETRVSA
jgi:hypothetical protein